MWYRLWQCPIATPCYEHHKYLQRIMPMFSLWNRIVNENLSSLPISRFFRFSIFIIDIFCRPFIIVCFIEWEGRIAQLVEPPAHNRSVVGSTPTAPTTNTESDPLATGSLNNLFLSTNIKGMITCPFCFPAVPAMEFRLEQSETKRYFPWECTFFLLPGCTENPK